MSEAMTDDLMESMVNNQECEIGIQIMREMVKPMFNRELDNNQDTELEVDTD
jgi:hypothetical protein